MKILIVGAGPTGLTAAVELSRHGHIPQIIEQNETPSGLSRAVGIHAHTMELLRPSGAADAIAREAVEIEGMILHDRSEPLARIPLGASAETHLYGLAQDRTEAHLAKVFERMGGKVRRGVQFLGLRQDDLGVSVDTSDGSERYDYVIGADGIGSPVREALGVAYVGKTLARVWSIADVDAVNWPDPGWFQGFILPEGGVAVVVPMAPGRFRAISNSPDALAALPRKLDTTAIRHTGTFQIQVRQVDHYQVGRVFLAGDAAHCHSPVGGWGMNLGMADAADLAERIATGTTGGYSGNRKAEGAKVIRKSEAIRQTVLSTNPAKKALIEAGIRLVGDFPPLTRELARQFIYA